MRGHMEEDGERGKGGLALKRGWSGSGKEDGVDWIGVKERQNGIE